ncbi:hypothetical protein SETIT_7G256900v2 [Setaria italica]|uniref:Uncharacterized protein n=2 Tax=Setaria italica TaxID=4555 RepID=A0A368RZP7_SETIT|nr:hypothetical protein SETIT_7G256900v2 [Setaria italica]
MARSAVASSTHRCSNSNSSLTSVAQSQRRTATGTMSSMANFAAQLKDKLLGLLDRVVNCGGAGAGANKDVPEEPTKLPNVQPIAIKPRDPTVSGGSKAGVN